MHRSLSRASGEAEVVGRSFGGWSHGRAEPSGRLTFACVGILVAGLLVLPQELRGDDAFRAVMLRQLTDGIEPVTKYSFIQPMLSVPPHWALDKLGFGIYAITLLPIVWMAAWSVAVWRILARERSAEFAHHAVVLTVVSMLTAYVVGFGSDVFTALGMSGGLIAGLLAISRAGRWTGWAVFVIAAANTPAMVVASAAIALALILRRREMRFAILPAAVFAAVVMECTWVTGELSFSRYASDEGGMQPMLPWGDVRGFGWPLWSGLLGILFSFGRGLVFFIPQLWNGPSRAADRVARVEHLLWIAAAALLPVYGTWWAWWGGVSFGPRFFMLAIVPAALAGARVICNVDRSFVRSLVVLAATLASAWIAFAGAVFGVTTRAFDECVGGGTFARDVLCIYTPEYSGIWAPIWAADPIGRRHVIFGAAVLLAVLPSMWATVIACKRTVLTSSSDMARHLRGPWRL